MPKILNVAHTPESLSLILAEVADFHSRLEALTKAMDAHSCGSLVVNYHGEMERGMKAFRNFVSDAENRLLEWRREQGHFRPQPKSAEPSAKEKRSAKK
jgi:hypothetical protein